MSKSAKAGSKAAKVANSSVVYVPLEDRLLVLPHPLPEEEMVGLLYVPQGAREKPQTGDVIAAGPGRVSEQGVLIPNPVSVGDVVLFGKYAGMELKLEQEVHLIIRASEVSMIVKQQ